LFKQLKRFIESIPLIRPFKLSELELKNWKVLSALASENDELADELVEDEEDRDVRIPIKIIYEFNLI